MEISHPSAHETSTIRSGGSSSVVRPAIAGKVALEIHESGLALVYLGAPDERVVTLTHERMASLKEALHSLKTSPPPGLVILGPSAEMFTAGADINLIRDVHGAAQAESLARDGQLLFQHIADLPCPTVAAISGPCVGGGCELVLACRYRLISDHKNSIIGLPEIKLGILPGFGGTQRLPRLIGLPAALDIILAGKTLRPKQALARGLVDEVLPFDKLKARAISLALGETSIRRKSPRLLDKILTHTNIGRRIVKTQAAKKIERETRGFYPAPPAALASAVLGLDQGMEVGLKFEAKELGRLIVTPESKALVKIFFLTEASKALGKSAAKAIQNFHTVVVGAGIMGAGIATAFAKNDCHVILKDVNDEALKRGMEQIRNSLAKMSYLSEAERSFILNRIETSKGEAPNQSNAHFAIEAIVEDLEVKKRVLGELARHMAPDALIATNTSSLSVTQIASAIDNPDRVIGMHFFNPVDKMPLVEIVRGQGTSDKAVVIVAALASKLGKFPVVVEDVPGFLVNRILAPYVKEAVQLLADGYSVTDIDQAALAFGMPMGPLRLLDEVGLDVAAHVSEVMKKGYGERMESPGFAPKLVAAGRKGKKSGGGFYDYDGDASTPYSDLRQILGITAAPPAIIDAALIQERLVLSLVNECIRALDEGVAGRPGKEAAEQIDLATVMGMGFPPFRGGLVHYAESLGAKKVCERLLHLAKVVHGRFTPWSGIVSRAASGKSFYEAADTHRR